MFLYSCRFETILVLQLSKGLYKLLDIQYAKFLFRNQCECATYLARRQPDKIKKLLMKGYSILGHIVYNIYLYVLSDLSFTSLSLSLSHTHTHTHTHTRFTLFFWYTGDRSLREGESWL